MELWGIDIKTSLKEKNPHPKNCKVILIYHWVHRLSLTSWHNYTNVMHIILQGVGILEECEGSSLLASQIEFIAKNTNFLLTSLVVGYLFLFKHCISDWPDWWLQESSSWASITTSITSNLLTQKICGWHNWFLCKIHSAFILCLTSTYKVQQKLSSYISVSEKHGHL